MKPKAALSKPEHSGTFGQLAHLTFDEDSLVAQFVQTRHRHLRMLAGPNGEQDGLLGTIKPLAPLSPPLH
jgi:hypothetical protein